MAARRGFGKRDAGRAAGENAGLHRFAVFTACATLLLIVAGGLVTSTESGLSVPDWPLSYGRLMPPMVGGIFYEHGHRMIATTVGLLTVLLAIWLARREPRAWVRRLGYAALAAVVAQGVLGGLTVLFLLPTAISVAHACLAQTFFCLVVTLALATSPRWRDGGIAEASAVSRIGAAAVAAIFLQLLIGAVMRHDKAGLAIPDFPLAFGRVVPDITSFAVAIHYAHRVWAVVVAGMVIACLVAAVRSRRPGLARTGVGLALLVVVQILLGGATVLTRKAVPIATAHVATGALLLATALALTLGARRIPLARAGGRGAAEAVPPPRGAMAWK
ncbi:MAG: COX15/CtaA family protein [Acidobacteria bacterium]|nr:COX15/CtaA family protein [Acidobacteriota bacterium]MCA1612025.1 COX15/CtaA family protein [Acidobacteriota bacterium]MCA1617233.1 COX15/CtaA family protein [Acidobacteriota bacterium]